MLHTRGDSLDLEQREVCVGKGRIELLLALGANRIEATSETMQRCLVLALTPVLNQMSVMGIVSIPGMMTGQILGGTSPSQVPKRQMPDATCHVMWSSVICHYRQNLVGHLPPQCC